MNDVKSDIGNKEINIFHNYEVINLPNGIVLLLEYLPQYRSVNISYYLKRGSRDERIEIAGISHFLEHMIFKGNSKYDKFFLNRYFDKIGGNINAYTSNDEIVLYNTIPSFYLKETIDIINSIFFNMELDSNEINLERDVILTELEQSYEDPSSKIADDFYRYYFKERGLGINILGTEKSLKSFNKEILQKYYEENFVFENTIVSIAGNFDKNLVIDIFSSLNNRNSDINNDYKIIEKNGDFDTCGKNCDEIEGKNLTGNVVKDNKNRKIDYLLNNKSIATNKNLITKKKVGFSRSKSELVHCVIGKYLDKTLSGKYNFDNKTFFSMLNIFNIIFGHSYSSKLYQIVRDQYGLCYTISSSITTHRNEYVFDIYFSSQFEKFEKVIELIREIKENILHKGIEEKDFENAKEKLIGKIILNSDNLSRRNYANLNYYLNFNKTTFNEMINVINNIKLEEINKILNILFEELYTQILYKNNFNILKNTVIKNL